MKILQSLLAFAPVALIAFSAQSQIDGDNIFSQDQVIEIDLNFSQPDFWDLLTENYEADENEYIEADLILTDVTGTYNFPDVGVRLKGNSSYSHTGDKKSFKIDFNKFVTGQDYDGLKKLNFSNGFKDPSVIREKVFFDVCREAGVPAPRASFSNARFNGEDWGFYTVIEQIDDQFLDWRILDDDGNLFKAGDNFGGGGPGGGGGGSEADLVDYGSDQSSYEERYELKTNEDINDWSDLIDLIDFINNSSDEEFENGIANRIEWTEYLRTVALDNLFSNLDSYTGSARNYYIYHNLSTDKWEWIKWDGNESFGSYSNNAGDMLTLDLDYHNADRPLLERLFESEVLYDQYLTEVCDITANYFNSEYLDARIDELAYLVRDDVYADDNKMYSNADFETNLEDNLGGGGGPGGGTTYGLKSFVADRSDFVEDEVDCSLFSSVGDYAPLEFSLYPNPAVDQLQINLESGSFKTLQLMDGSGRVVLNETIQSPTLLLNVGELARGLYFIKLESDDESVSQRVVLH